jgi:hypothetical protein
MPKSEGRILKRASISDANEDTEDCLDRRLRFVTDWTSAVPRVVPAGRAALGVGVPRAGNGEIGLPWIGVRGLFFVAEAGQSGGPMLPCEEPARAASII